MSTALEIGIALAAFVGILAAKRRDWITFAASLLAMLIRRIDNHEHARAGTLAIDPRRAFGARVAWP
jgi:hypothetical protein